MIASYADTFEPIRLRQAAPDERFAMVTGAQNKGFFVSADSRRAAGLVEHATYWNYVAIIRIAEFCAGQFPQVGVPIRGGQQQHLTAKQRQHLTANYGRILQSSYDDLAPLPEAHPFVELLTAPNPEDTWEEFATEALMFWQVTGVVYIWAIPNGFGVPASLVVVPPQWVEEKRNQLGVLTHYEVTPEGDRARTIDVPAEEMFKGRQKSLKSKTDGLSALEAAPLWSDCVEWIERSRAAHFRNGSNPDAMILLGDRYKDPREEVITRIKERFARRTAGVDRSGEPLVVPPDIKVEKWSHSPQEMDYPETSASARRNNLALHGVPPIVAGIADDYTRATADAGLLMMSQYVANPKLRRFAGLLQKIARRFDSRLVVWFADTTPDDPQLLLEQQKADFACGAIDPDEIRTLRGREPKGEPSYQTGYVGVNQLPLSEAALPEEPEPVPEEDQDAEEEPTDDKPDDTEDQDDAD